MQDLNCLSCLDSSAFAFVSISTILDVSLNTNPAMSFTLTNLELVQDTRGGEPGNEDMVSPCSLLAKLCIS